MNNIVVAILFSVFLKWATGLFDYSGKGKPPMYGDYEAQRHWMEVTLNLPIKEWYFQTDKNDLEYWGLDYPPLTAYHSLLMGHIANYSNPKYVALNSSRGFESSEHKLFMRYTVLFSDLFSFIPGVIFHSLYNRYGKHRWSIVPESYVMLVYPGLILIDYGHFQYNCVSLGLALLAYEAVTTGSDIMACILFSLAVSYKQMLLYLSLPFFFYQLGKCRQSGAIYGFFNLLKLSVVVVFTFLISWYPVANNYQQLFQVLHRIFPLARGVFEDKVSNFWCLLNVIFKFRNYLSNENIALICAVLTLLISLPSCFDLFISPSRNKFTLSLINASLAFFLFSYQVHEKSILIVALPVMLYFRSDSFHCFWFLIVSSCSMFPLIAKDGLVIPFISLHMLFVVTLDLFYNIFNFEGKTKNSNAMQNKYYIFYISISIWLLILLSSLVFSPPEKYPDLFPLLISCYGAVHFIYFLIYFNFVQLVVSDKKQV